MAANDGLANAPAVVLVRPQEEGNVGAVARAMANMGLERLLLVEPAVALGATARAFAVRAGTVLDGAERHPSLASALAPFERVVGTTSSRSRSSPAALLTPRQLAVRLAAEPPRATALLFGPEASGLTTDELARCAPLVRIPCHPRQPTLNLGQAVLIVAYELYQARSAAAAHPVAEPRSPASPAALADQIEGLFSQLAPLLREIGFARDDTFGAVLRDLRRLAARSGLTQREVAILRGICRRAQRRLEWLESRAGSSGG